MFTKFPSCELSTFRHVVQVVADPSAMRAGPGLFIVVSHIALRTDCLSLSHWYPVISPNSDQLTTCTANDTVPIPHCYLPPKHPRSGLLHLTATSILPVKKIIIIIAVLLALISRCLMTFDPRRLMFCHFYNCMIPTRRPIEITKSLVFSRLAPLERQLRKYES